MLSSNYTEMAFVCLNLKYSYSLHRFLFRFQFSSLLWNWFLSMLSESPSKKLLVLSSNVSKIGHVSAEVSLNDASCDNYIISTDAVNVQNWSELTSVYCAQWKEFGWKWTKPCLMTHFCFISLHRLLIAGLNWTLFNLTFRAKFCARTTWQL